MKAISGSTKALWLHLEKIELRDVLIGVLDHEKTTRQSLIADLHVWIDASAAVASDDVLDTLDYRHLLQTLEAVAYEKHTNLLETLAYRMVEKLLDVYPLLQVVKLRLYKPKALEPICTSVEIEQRRHVVALEG